MELTKERTYETDHIQNMVTPKKVIKLGVESSAMGFIIDNLTDMYADKISSSVRELVSNALDATYDNKGDIYIYLPTAISREFSVKDYGTGMNMNELETIYTKYGASKKRENMNAIGSYGLGAKTPLAYTNAFNIKTVKDGELILGQVSRSSSGTNLNILYHEKNKDLPNQTTISFNVKKEDVDKFLEAVKTYKKHRQFLSSMLHFSDEEEFK